MRAFCFVLFCLAGIVVCMANAGAANIKADATSTADDSSADEKLQFNRDIRPILSENCFHCHGPDAKKRAADLRLDEFEGATEWAIVPGQADESEVIARVLSDDPDLVMPPPDSGRSISAQQVATLKQWIDEGAEYQLHWSFEPVVAPTPPATSFDARVRNPIDSFVFRRLEDEGLAPQPEADRATLLRRITFDLTGLPPTVEELDTFLADDSPDALSNAVDRLFASQHYGERMAADWLDVARYSDTFGYQRDDDRRVWPWRDWVIRAFNKNTPFDEFVTKQLAGDLLPNATRDDILATTFNRLHGQNNEGGSVPEEFRIEYVSDRAQTFSTAFLGLTMECCRCHDHKYDPLSQAEYFGLSSYFDNIDEAGLYSYFTKTTPTPALDLPTAEQEAELATLAEFVATLEAQTVPFVDQAFEGWLASGPSPEPAQQLLHLTFDDKDFEPGRNTLVPRSSSEAASPAAETDGETQNLVVQLTGDDEIKTDVGEFRRQQPFSIALWMKTPDVKERAVVFHRSRAWTDAASKGYQLLIEDGRLSWSLIHYWPGNAARIKTVEPLPTGQWHHVTVTSDGSSSADGLAIYLDGQRVETEVVRDGLTRSIKGNDVDNRGDTITIGARYRDRGLKNGFVDDFMVFERQLAKAEIQQLHDGHTLTDLLAKSANERTDADVAALKEVFNLTANKPLIAHRQAIQAAREAYGDAFERVPQIMVMQELDERPTYVLNRGVYDQPTEQTPSTVPSILPPVDAGLPTNRLGLAKWLTSDNHPLTARVYVNRLWQLFFGLGLVETTEDFGSQGTAPSHPELLDWLARDFMDHGWDIQRTLKLIVTSATYRQSSDAPADLIARDPGNRLLAHGPSARLSAEMLRDNALYVSGLLVDEVGGPPARPYEVSAAFVPTEHDTGDGLYKRSVYTYWKRTSPAPMMLTLDAATRDVCQVRREKTSTPLQALVLLNSPQYAEAARILAEQLVIEHDGDDAALVTDLFRKLTSHQPTEKQLGVLTGLLAQQRAAFRSDTQAAEAFLQIGEKPRNESLAAAEVAAVTSVATTLFNYDGCVTKR